MVEPNRPQIILWCTHIACCVTKATHTHTHTHTHNPCFSTTTTVARTPPNFELYVHCLLCYISITIRSRSFPRIKRQKEHFLISEVVYLTTTIFTVINISLFIPHIKLSNKQWSCLISMKDMIRCEFSSFCCGVVEAFAFLDL